MKPETIYTLITIGNDKNPVVKLKGPEAWALERAALINAQRRCESILIEPSGAYRHIWADGVAGPRFTKVELHIDAAIMEERQCM
jgi:hypothetical protein